MSAIAPTRPNQTQMSAKTQRSRGPGLRRSATGRWGAKSSAFNWKAYGSRCASLRLLRQNKTHVDTLIITNDGFSDLVHWQIFSASCPKLIEQSNLHKSKQKSPFIGRIHTHVELPDGINGAMARLLIECAYGEPHLSIDDSNLDEFYHLCAEYELSHGIRACLNYARRLLNADNCVYLLQLALNHEHRKLKRAAYLMMRSNFKSIIQVNRDFHKLDFNCLKSLLQDDRLALNGQEELAWLAIMRWLSTKPMTKARLASLYSQMVAGPQDLQINLFPNAAINQQPSLTAAAAGAAVPRRHSTGAQAAEAAAAAAANQQMPVRISLNFHSSNSSLDDSSGRKQRLARATLGAISPLRTAANEAFYQAIPSFFVDEHKLESLIKCLRFLRFKSVNAFDIIAGHPLVSGRRETAHLIQLLRIKYKLWHQIALTSEESQLLDEDSRQKLKLEMASRTQRVLGRISRTIKSTALRNNQQAAAPGNPLVPSTNAQQLEIDCVQRASKPRVPNSIGLLLGGWQDGAISKTIWSYDFIYDRWFKLNIRLPEPRALHASCASPTSGHVYIFGGTNGTQILNSVWRFNPANDVHLSAGLHRDKTSHFNEEGRKPARGYVTKRSKLMWRTIRNNPQKGEKKKGVTGLESYKFKQLCPMNEHRCHLAGVWHSNGRLYALGGHNGSQRLKSAEWYDDRCNQWHPIADMTIARSDAAACSHENKIFIAGGQIGDQYIQTSVEFYKPTDDTWTFAAPMIIPRMSFCLASFKGQLLALGGTNGLMGGDEIASVTRSVERFSHESGSWTFCAPMAQKRCSFGTLNIGNKLLAVGGHGGCRRLKTCESLRFAQLTATPQVGSSAGAADGQAAAIRPASWQQANPSNQAARQQVALAVSNQQNLISSRGASAANQPLAVNNQRSSSLTAAQPSMGNNQLNLRLLNNNSHQMTLRSATRWESRANMPERRSGFSLAVVNDLRNARDYSYFGSSTNGYKLANEANKPCLIRQPSVWNKFKIIKRRKLIKHLKIALVVSIVILMM